MQITNKGFFDRFLEAHLDHLRSTDSKPYFVTATFLQTEEASSKQLPITPKCCFLSFERFYVRMLSKIISHYNRSSVRHLQPVTFVFVDFPFSKPKNKKSDQAAIYRRALINGRLMREHPDTSAHLHGIMAIKPDVLDKFEAFRSTAEGTFASLHPLNRTLHIVPISPNTEGLVLAYSAALLRAGFKEREWCQEVDARRQDLGLARNLRPHTGWNSLYLADADLFNWLPKGTREPSYQRLDYERELEEIMRNDHQFRLATHKSIARYQSIESQLISRRNNQCQTQETLLDYSICLQRTL